MTDKEYMKEALDFAVCDKSDIEIPVGAVIVKNGEIIARGKNTRESENDVLGHAEINAIKQAQKLLKSRRLDGCTLYTTLEPCIMCSAVISEARISRVVYGSADTEKGAAGGRINLFAYEFTKDVAITPFVLKEECDSVLNDFFKSSLRKSQNSN